MQVRRKRKELSGKKDQITKREMMVVTVPVGKRLHAVLRGVESGLSVVKVRMQTVNKVSGRRG